MSCCLKLCPNCEISVGFLCCTTCQQHFNFELCNGLPVLCPICINIKLETYYQPQEDVEKHQDCYRNGKRMFYYCNCCDGYFCMCVEKQLKKKCILQLPQKRMIQRV